MKYRPLVSIIIIDYKRNNPYLIECLDAIQKQTYRNFEVILVCDYPVDLKYPNLKIKSYGHFVGPAEKRDEGAKMSKGDILAFIDDDAYPSETWLENIVPHFKNKNISGVGGPGITPPNVHWKEQSSGWASASPIGAGPFMYRFLPGERQYVDDFPSMNLAVRKTDFISVGGYDSSYWPGEDTKLCLDITHKINKKIAYEPEAIVYHHRRPILKAHLRQNGNFGLHRGYFARILPKTSRKLIYFLPSALLLVSVCLPALYLFQWSFPYLRYLLTLSILLYFSILIANSFWILKRSRSVFQSVLSIPVIYITHLWYGYRFIQGLFFTDKLIQ